MYVPGCVVCVRVCDDVCVSSSCDITMSLANIRFPVRSSFIISSLPQTLPSAPPSLPSIHLDDGSDKATVTNYERLI